MSQAHPVREQAARQGDADALVFFGASGDLARKQIFPALRAMVEAGELSVPVVGVAHSGWDTADLRKRLDDFYLRNGMPSGVRLDIPKGDYRIVCVSPADATAPDAT